ncbi:hypothetical protein PR001_g1392 [Phytophthora rubi]|uniref:B box-type domain-containing protein n=1 Tax=Phytophthora rubi TaxID=129364 RepID=A0A6A3PFQ1_9STRA|nr:hypothetical protein PR001_g1392 [Phytophthora rubi]
MMAVEVDGAREEGGADGWSGTLTDAVTKCGRDSDRRLYVYGISLNRCPKCQARLRSDNDTCASCHYTHKTPRKCLRCSQKNDPVMWCAECDAYFCAGCYKKPHVLMLGSTKPHHCFAIDGASGKHFVDSAWSDEFATMVQETYRRRLHDKMVAEETPAKAPTPEQQEQQAEPAVNGAPDQTAPASSAAATPPQHPAAESSSPATATSATDGTAEVSTTFGSNGGSTQTSSSSDARTQEQSRKRQLPGPDDTRDRIQKALRSQESSRTAAAATAAPPDGMSLYDRVEAMHDMRAKAVQPGAPQAPSPKMSLNQLLTQQTDERQRLLREQQERGKREAEHILQQQREQTDQLRKEQVQMEQAQLRNELRLQEEQRRQAEQQRQEELRRQAEQQRQEELRRQAEQQRQEELRRQAEQQRQEKLRRQAEQQRQEELRRQAEQQRQEELRRQAEQQQLRQQAEQQRQQRLLEERMRHEQILRQEESRRQQQAEAQSLGNRFVSQAQHTLHAPPGYAVASMAPSNISAPMLHASNARFIRVPSPVSASPHAPRFEPASSPPRPQHPFQGSADPPVANGYTPVDGSQIYHGHGEPVSRFETISQEPTGNHHIVVRNPNVQRSQQQQQEQQPAFSEEMVPRAMSSGSGGFSPSKSGEDDELRAIWVSDYDKVNALIAQLDEEISKRNEEGHQFVHMSNNINIPEQLKLKIHQLRAQRDAAMKKRFESVVRVLIFSDAVRSFAQQNEHTNIWYDVPDALKASHKKCAELAASIEEFEGQAQKLRNGIDEAVSSGNPAQMQNVVHLGALIADLERKIRASNAERDTQFIFMFQFSDTLRNMVRSEWAATGRGYHLQSSQ